VTDGRRARWDEHRQQRRAELIEAAIVAVRDYGDSVGMDQIAAVAHTSKPVIYRYFADKAELYQAVGQRMATQLHRMMTTAISGETEPRARLRAGIDAYLAVLDDTPELYGFVVKFPRVDRGPDGQLIQDFMSKIGELITAQLRGDLVERGLDPSMAMPWGVAIMGFVRAAGDWWLANQDAMTRDDLADYLTGLLWNGSAGVYGATPTSGLGVPASPGPARETITAKRR
jgi:AcrR family transcriptional regulator